MSPIEPDTWQRLGSFHAGSDALLARIAAPDETQRLFAAKDGTGQRHFLIRLEPTEPSLQDTLSRGLSAHTKTLAVNGQGPDRYLDIACNDPSGYEAFDLVGSDLAAKLALVTVPPTDAATQVLAKWRRFWGQPIRQTLSAEEQLGLLAELWFLIRWLARSIGPRDAVTRWRGPLSSRHDFEWQGGSVEVKATRSTRGRLHRINGLDQLAPPDTGPLMLFSFRVREEAGAYLSLPKIIDDARSLLAGDEAALALFERNLDQAGYQPIHEAEYSKTTYHLVGEELYSVTSDFPRLTPAQLVDQHPPMGVSMVSYEINLDGFGHLRLADSPSNAPSFAAT